MMPSRAFIGLDGCRGGWICARWDGADALQLSRIARLEDLLAAGAPAALPMIAIDMPIGLPETVGPKGRTAERLARPNLGPRQSSVFSVPARAAVEAGVRAGVDEATRYRAACAAARATSNPPRAVAKQCFHIFPKIMEVDALLRSRPELLPFVHECHPEVAFWAMNGCSPVRQAKKVKNRPNPAGLDLRKGLLEAEGLPIDALTAQAALALKAGLDDLIDACACAWTAKRVAYGKALRFPDPPEQDAHGLPVCITA
ncbi:DUF429 domain-containing protein [Xanthobacter sp. ZOL 2024]